MPVQINPYTGDLMPKAVAGTVGTVTSVAGGVGLTGTPDPIVAAGTLDLDINSLTTGADPLAAGDLFPFVDVSIGTAPANQRKVAFSAIESALTLANLTGNLAPARISPQGAASGLDADLLDGSHAAAFAAAAHAHAASDITSGTLAVAQGGTGTSTAFTAGSIVFAGAAGVYSQDNANLFWDDANDRLGVQTASPIQYAAATFGNPIAFIGTQDLACANACSIGVATMHATTMFARSLNKFWVALDYQNASSSAEFRVLRDGYDTADVDARTLLLVDENAVVCAGQAGVPGAFALSLSGAGGFAATIMQLNSPSTQYNRLTIENTTVGGSGICGLELCNGAYMWDPAASVVPGDFHAGATVSLLTQWVNASKEHCCLESLCNIECVLDNDNDEVDAMFRISRNGHFNAATHSLLYWPGTGFYGETCFSVTERGVVYTPAWKVHRKALSAAYTLDTWVDFDGCDDLLLECSYVIPTGLTITLPAPSAANAGRMLCIKDSDGGSYALPISLSLDVDDVEGSGNAFVEEAFGARWLYSNGTAWKALTQKSNIAMGSMAPKGDMVIPMNYGAMCVESFTIPSGRRLEIGSGAVFFLIN